MFTAINFLYHRHPIFRYADSFTSLTRQLVSVGPEMLSTLTVAILIVSKLF